MNEICFLFMTFAIILALFIVLIVVLRNGKATFSLKKDKKKDALFVQTEHHDNELDK